MLIDLKAVPDDLGDIAVSLKRANSSPQYHDRKMLFAANIGITLSARIVGSPRLTSSTLL